MSGATPNLDPSDFLSAVIPDVAEDWFIEIRSKDVDGRVHQDFCTTPDQAIRVGRARGGQADVWFGVGPRVRRRGTKQDVGALGTVWVDEDFKHFPDGAEGAERALSSFPLEPSILVASGGGFQPYWLLNEPATPEYFTRIEAINRGLTVALAPEGTTLDAAVDAARVLRLPGTTNFKYSPPRPVRIVHCRPERRYGITDLEQALPAPKSKLASAPRPHELGGVIPEGQRNSELASLAGTMRRRGLTESEIEAALLAVNSARCTPPLSEIEVERIAASIGRYQPARPLSAIERQAWALARRLK